MNIGTAKPNKEVLKSIKHHLIDIKNPDDNYNVGDFVKVKITDCTSATLLGRAIGYSKNN